MTEMKQGLGWISSIGKVRDFLIIMIRHKIPFLYAFLNLANNVYGYIFFRHFKNNLIQDTWDGIQQNDSVRVLTVKDIPQLVKLIQSASEKSKSLFNPHAINEITFKKLMQAPYYLAIGYYISGELVGYIFLRLYFPQKAFAGYFVADSHQGKGIGKHLFQIIKNISHETAFTLYTHVMEDNIASLHVSSEYVIDQKIPGGYLVLKHIDKRKS